MNIVAWSDRYPPGWCAGSELMLHEMLLLLQERGHQVRVLCPYPASQQVDGIQVFNTSTNVVADALRWGDVFIAHLERSRDIMAKAVKALPLVYLAHFSSHVREVAHLPQERVLVVFNAQSTKDDAVWTGDSIVVPPPVNPDRYRTTRGSKVTLINTNVNKGGAQFLAMAKAMPDIEFLGVRGAYGHQLQLRGRVSNLKFHAHTFDVRSVYAQTRILVMPSERETYGRTAIEAAASGIPTIASPTPGLQEALGDAGIYVDRNNINGWVQAIRDLQDPNIYEQASLRALQRSRDLDPRDTIDHLEQALLRHVGKFATDASK